MLATLVAILCNGQLCLCLLRVCLWQLHSQTRRLMLVISKPIMLSKEYLEAARSLFRVARTTVNQTIAGWRKALAEDYERRAEQTSHNDAASTSALRAGAARAR
jgi:hypothetical protein